MNEEANGPVEVPEVGVISAEGLEDLLGFLRDARGFDFTGYKRTSLGRRIRKRMLDVGVSGFDDYRDLLETNAAEFDALFNTILINVTAFFRDRTAWQYLQQEVLPDLLDQAGSTGDIRLWSAGCSTGEEAYSLAIACAELMGISQFLDRVKIYGTDVDQEALHQARSGMYSTTALDSVPEDLRGKYFEATPAGYVFRPDMRRRVIFGRHDVTRDAPISRLQLLACRNTLMYFNIGTQAQIIDRFHFALREGGYLFLGKAEMLLSDGERFEVANLRQRVFRRRSGDSGRALSPMVGFERLAPIAWPAGAGRHQVRDLVLETDPDAVIALDADGRVALVNQLARTKLGLTASDVGKPFKDLELSYRPTELRSLIDRVQSDLRPLRVSAVESRRGPDEVDFHDIVIHPLTRPEQGLCGVVLRFTDTTASTHTQQDLKRCREDLETACAELQSVTEELETSNEELHSSIEELETTNEELQSTNEELETTNEELQSGNEELETMNEELRIRSTELDEARAFLDGVLSSVATAVIVLAGDLTVREWNRGARDMWGLRRDEVVGRKFFDLQFGLPTSRISPAVHDCLAHGTRQQLVVEAINRLGVGIRCGITCSPLDGRPAEGAPVEGVVLLIEPVAEAESGRAECGGEPATQA